VDAFRILEERPVSGFLEQSLIYELPLIADLDLDALTKERLGLRSRFVDLGVQVSYQGVFLDMISSLQISDTGDITTVSRRYGSEE
ncbi:MAG: type II secretion system minor pseudopilin GspK, partial [Pseudomonadota bacterium]